MSTPNPLVRGPGLLYVTSRISSPILSPETYFHWYDADHIEEIIHTSGMPSAFRYIDVDISRKELEKEKVYLAFYPMQDLAFTQGEEFRKIRVKSELLPGSGVVYDLAELDVRYLGLRWKGGRKGGGKVAGCVVVFGVEPGVGTGEEGVEGWFAEEHIPAVSKVKGHIRSTLYRLQYARTNAQSRALKGLPTTDAPAPEPPTWLAMHEFEEVVTLPAEVEETPNAEKVLGNAKQVERATYGLAKALGDRSFF